MKGAAIVSGLKCYQGILATRDSSPVRSEHPLSISFLFLLMSNNMESEQQENLNNFLIKLPSWENLEELVYYNFFFSLSEILKKNRL